MVRKRSGDDVFGVPQKEEITIRTRFVVEKKDAAGKMQTRFIDAINEEAALELAKKIEW